jgi:hypothetical protein
VTTSRNVYRKRGTGGFQNTGHFRVTTAPGLRRLQHVVIAEAAHGGKPLPAKAMVHHVNGDPGDNRPENLVICPDQAYHKLLHVRTAAMDACGNPNWRSCRFCKRYDALENMRQLSPVHGIERPIWEHVECSRAWSNAYYRRRRQAGAAK